VGVGEWVGAKGGVGHPMSYVFGWGGGERGVWGVQVRMQYLSRYQGPDLGEQVV